jgi:glutaredoxin
MPQENVRDEHASVSSTGYIQRVDTPPGSRGRSTMTVVKLYSKPDCHLCVEARAALERVQADLPFELYELDITSDESLHRTYFERIPVVVFGDEELFEYFVEEGALRERLEAIL